jgi:hypothetical protein
VATPGSAASTRAPRAADHHRSSRGGKALSRARLDGTRRRRPWSVRSHGPAPCRRRRLPGRSRWKRPPHADTTSAKVASAHVTW